jgi:hypothetical protein
MAARSSANRTGRDRMPTPTARATEMAPHVLAYSLTRVMNIMGIHPLMAAIQA